MWPYNETWVDVWFNMKVSVWLFLSKLGPTRSEASFIASYESRFVGLVNYVFSNPLRDENETHERMFLRTDMGRCRHVTI